MPYGSGYITAHLLNQFANYSKLEGKNSLILWVRKVDS
jgi:hypothetical protein